MERDYAEQLKIVWQTLWDLGLDSDDPKSDDVKTALAIIAEGLGVTESDIND